LFNADRRTYLMYLTVDFRDFANALKITEVRSLNFAENIL